MGTSGPADPRQPCWLKQWSAPVLAPPTPAYGFAGSNSLGLGKSADNQWWMVRLDPTKVGAGNGWISATFVSTSNTDNVPRLCRSPARVHFRLPQVAPRPAVPGAREPPPIRVHSGPGTRDPVVGYAAAGATTTPTGISADGALDFTNFQCPILSTVTGYLWVSASFVVQRHHWFPVVNAIPAPRGCRKPHPQHDLTDCALVSQTPGDGACIPPDTAFTVTWVLKNTGTNAWVAGEDCFREPSITSGSARVRCVAISQFSQPRSNTNPHR